MDVGARGPPVSDDMCVRPIAGGRLYVFGAALVLPSKQAEQVIIAFVLASDSGIIGIYPSHSIALSLDMGEWLRLICHACRVSSS